MSLCISRSTIYGLCCNTYVFCDEVGGAEHGWSQFGQCVKIGQFARISLIADLTVQQIIILIDHRLRE